MKIINRTIKYCIGDEKIKSIFGKERSGDLVIYYEDENGKIGVNIKIDKSDWKNVVRSTIDAMESIIYSIYHGVDDDNLDNIKK